MKPLRGVVQTKRFFGPRRHPLFFASQALLGTITYTSFNLDIVSLVSESIAVIHEAASVLHRRQDDLILLSMQELKTLLVTTYSH
jgi:hypothetical protein